MFVFVEEMLAGALFGSVVKTKVGVVRWREIAYKDCHTELPTRWQSFRKLDYISGWFYNFFFYDIF